MLALDIGAGNTSFGKDLKRLNPQIKTIICGDPIFQRQEYSQENSLLENIGVFLSRFSKILTQDELQEVIEKSKSGVFRIVAEYKNIPMEDNSLDIVTLNSPHPRIYPGKVGFDEMRRVLKTGGIFYFGHSRENYLEFEEKEFELIGSGRFAYGGENLAQLYAQELQFPMSPVMKNNLIASKMLEKGYIQNRAGSIYGTGPTKMQINPSWKAWRKK